MHFEVGLGHKTFVAQCTEELEILGVVGDHMSLEAVPHTKGLATVAAAHRPLARMRPEVHGQSQPAVELLVAVGAGRLWAVTVHTHTMGNQARPILVVHLA